MTAVLGEEDVARVNRRRFAGLARVSPSAHGLVHTPPASDDHLVPGETQSASFPVDDVHQSRIAEGIGGWILGEDKQRDRLRSISNTPVYT